RGEREDAVTAIAGELRAERACRSRRRERALDVRRGHPERAEQLVVPVHGPTEARQVAGLDGLHTILDRLGDVVEEPLVAWQRALPPRAQRLGTRARPRRDPHGRDDQGEGPSRAEAGDGGRIAAYEPKAASDDGGSRVDVGRGRAEERLEPAAERKLH